MKKLFLFVSLMIISITGCGESTNIPTTQNKSVATKEHILFFTHELDEAKLLNLIGKYNLSNVTELRFKIGDITAGYIPRSNNIADEIKKGLHIHIKQTNEILKIEQNTQSKNIKTAPDMQEKLNRLKKSIYFASNNKFAFAGINLKNPEKNVLQDLADDGIINNHITKNQKYITNKDSQLYSLYHENWAPYEGSAEVNQYRTYNTFRFNNVSAFSNMHSYEHETQFYDNSFWYSFANYDGYWSSDMPATYLDSHVSDDPRIENHTVGSNQPVALINYRYYYTYIALKPGFINYCDIRIKGQLGQKRYAGCYSGTWCTLTSLATTGSLLYKNAPWYYNEWWTY